MLKAKKHTHTHTHRERERERERERMRFLIFFHFYFIFIFILNSTVYYNSYKNISFSFILLYSTIIILSSNIRIKHTYT